MANLGERLGYRAVVSVSQQLANLANSGNAVAYQDDNLSLTHVQQAEKVLINDVILDFRLGTLD